MRVPGWPITFVLICHFGSATSSPFILYTHAASIPSQISPPSPTHDPFLFYPPLSSSSPFIGSPEESSETEKCLKISPPTVVVRFGDPVRANCSKERIGLSVLGWNVPQEGIEPTTDDYLIWSINSVTEWSIKATCYALVDVAGQCNIDLNLIVYQPPQNVLIKFVNHTGPMLEGHQYILQCFIQDVAPIENVIVTFYRGKISLAQLQSNSSREKTPVNASFTLSITASSQDNRTQYWCDVTLNLGPGGPQENPVVKSQSLIALVLSNPQQTHRTEQQSKANSSCEMERNFKPCGSGTTNSWKTWKTILFVIVFTQMIDQF